MTFAIKDFHDKIVTMEENSLNEGEQVKIFFTNGWAASVVRGPFTYGGPEGLWEFGVFNKDGHLDYENPVTPCDVEGYLSDETVVEMLSRLANMTPEELHEYKVEARRREFVEMAEGLYRVVVELDKFDERVVSELPFDLKMLARSLRTHFELVAADSPEEIEDTE